MERTFRRVGKRVIAHHLVALRLRSTNGDVSSLGFPPSCVGVEEADVRSVESGGENAERGAAAGSRENDPPSPSRAERGSAWEDAQLRSR